MSLEILQLNKKYYQGAVAIDVIKNLNLKLQQGEVAAIIGPSGSGKSTFLSLVAGLDSADSGQINIDSVDLCSLNQNQLTKIRSEKISIVFQQYHLIPHLTALENVSLALEILNKPMAQEKALSVLAQMGLSERVHHFPSQLSGGECQRVAIARALVVQPALILADEPSGNLDTLTGDKVMNVFLDKVKEHKITTILVTHSEALAQKCQRVFRLVSGQLIEDRAVKGTN
ncbi:MAG: ABC transporter ATP-binding protein [Pseudobdellovibrionaceae bacterium]